LLKSVRKIQVSLNSDEKNVYCTWIPTHVYDESCRGN